MNRIAFPQEGTAGIRKTVTRAVDMLVLKAIKMAAE